MWKNVGKIQQNCLNISKKINLIIKQIRKLSDDEQYVFIEQNVQSMIAYGKSALQVIQVFQMEKWVNKIDYIIKLCNEYEKKDTISEQQEFLLFQKLMDDVVNITDEVIYQHQNEQKVCTCCGEQVYYLPISAWYKEQEQKYNVEQHIPETLNEIEYICPCCGASDRDRLLIAMLKKLRLNQDYCEEALLQVAPAKAIEHWINGNCPSLQYHSTDLYMDHVTFTSDIQDMSMIEDESYDYVICSHVLEHVRDDRKAMRELQRILKKDGFGLLLVPIALDMKEIDEEWGLSEAENWRRFGQNDHCRRYTKNGFVKRLEEAGFYVHQLSKSFFGEKLFEQNSLTDTSVLYVVTKINGDMEKLIHEKRMTRNSLKGNEPLVSVLMSAYNHEAYVGKAIESVLNQSYKNIEFLVADDHSTDGTANEICKYEDKIDEIHLFGDNAYGRLRFLSARAKGKYIAIINSDDMWDESKIQKQVEYMENHPKVAACFTGVQHIDENDNIFDMEMFLMDNMSKEEWLHRFFYQGNCLAHPSVLIHTEIYQKLQNSGISMFRQIPDLWMWTQLVQKHEIHIIEKELMQFRMHESGDNANTSARTLENSIRHCCEECYLWYRTISDMDDFLFKKVFTKELIYKDADSHKKVLCEKFFLLKNANKNYLRQEVLFFMYDICKDDEIVAILKEHYGFQYIDMYKVSGSME